MPQQLPPQQQPEQPHREPSVRAQFAAQQAHIAQRARLIFETDLRAALAALSEEWSAECDGFEAEVARAEEHYQGICESVEELNALADAHADADSNFDPGADDDAGAGACAGAGADAGGVRLAAANASLRRHCTLYDGIALGLKQSLRRLTGPGGFTDRLLATAAEAQRQFFLTALPPQLLLLRAKRAVSSGRQ